MASEKIATFAPAPLEPGQRIRIVAGPRRGDWLVLSSDERKMRLKCPVSGREVEWDRFASFSGMLDVDEWPSSTPIGESSRQYPLPDAAETAERYRMLVEQSPLSISIHQDGRFVFVNAATANLLAADSPKELIGRAMIDIVHPDDREKVLERVRSMASGGIAPRVEERFVRLDGTVITAEVTAIPIRFGGRLAFQVVAADVSERKRLEGELRNAQKLTRMGTWSMDPATGRILWSEELYSLLGVDPSVELPSLADFILRVFPADLAEVKEAFKTSVREHAPYSLNHRIVRPDGEVRHLAVRGEWVSDHYDGRLRLMGSALDVTEKATLEAELRQAQKMEALGTLAGGVAHDFNNILAAVNGYSELAFDLTPPDSKARGYLAEVLKAASRAQDLVRQILAFSRKSEEKRAEVDVGQVVRETVTMLRATIPSSISIISDIDHRSLVTRGNATEVQQVAANLITNAFHAVKDSFGTIMVEVGKRHPIRQETLQVGEVRPGDYVTITVSDNGPGINEELLQKIFDPFFTTKKIGEGSGLGLSVVHGIVSSMDGAIEVRSNPGDGATFRVYLPLTSGAAAAEVKGRDARSATSPALRVLVVDDEEALAQLGKSLLETLGHEAVAACGHREALERLGGQPGRFDLIFSDQTMPGMTGLQLIEAARAIDPGLATILCTGFSEELNDAVIAKSSIGCLLMKPFSRNTLSEALSRALAARESR